jgi:hypothetical protein
VSEYLIKFYEQKLDHLSQFIRFNVGLADSTFPHDLWMGVHPNSYAITTRHLLHLCWLAGETHLFELPTGAVRPSWKTGNKNVYGCGLVLDSKDKLATFFTLNGNLLGELVLEYFEV